jgi:hypothetical protein
VGVNFQMFCMYVKLIVCIWNLVFLGMPRIFILYALGRNYVLYKFVIPILKLVWMLYTVIGIMYRMAENPVSILEASQLVSVRLR